jgi:SAM-dependent methyltransferase
MLADRRAATDKLQGTFRDPAGSLHDVDGRILRGMRPEFVDAFRSVLGARSVRALIERGSVVGAAEVSAAELPSRLSGSGQVWFEHARVPFVSLPCEWSAGMLADAARHTLDVALELVRDGYILKDATPANVLFDGPKPVFVDLPSIEPLQPCLSLWLARHQFETTFLLPLLANLDLGYPIRAALSDPARGLSHEELARLYGARRWTRLERLRHVAIPASLGAIGGGAGEGAGRRLAPTVNLARTQFILERSLLGLRVAIDGLAKRISRRNSHWSEYASTRTHYSPEDLDTKRSFVQKVIHEARARWILDVGANTGEFSEMAARSAATVGIDLDEVSVSAIHARAAARNLPLQALVVDLSQPTPPSGWCNAERRSFLDRASGRFDLALMLAVGHHLRVSAGIPLQQILELGFELGGGSLLFEFVPTSDPMFAAIARGREPLYEDNTVENCLRLLRDRGRVELAQPLQNGRVLYWVRRT